MSEIKTSAASNKKKMQNKIKFLRAKRTGQSLDTAPLALAPEVQQLVDMINDYGKFEPKEKSFRKIMQAMKKMFVNTTMTHEKCRLQLLSSCQVDSLEYKVMDKLISKMWREAHPATVSHKPKVSLPAAIITDPVLGILRPALR